MNKTGWIVLAVVVIIVLLGGWYMHAHKAMTGSEAMTGDTSAAATTSDTSTTDGTVVSVGGTVVVDTNGAKTVTVTYSDQGFSPNSVSIAIGDTVKFVNNSSHGMWVASDAHPTHTEYDGTSTMEHCKGGTDIKGGFDECTAVNAGTSYSFTFPKAGTFEYHNHVRSGDTGTVTVK